MPLFASEQDRKYAMFGLRIVGDFGASIAIPVVVLVWLAQRLEIKFGHAPYLTIIAFVVAAAFSGWSVYSKAKTYAVEYQKLNEAVAKVKKPITKL